MIKNIIIGAVLALLLATQVWQCRSNQAKELDMLDTISELTQNADSIRLENGALVSVNETLVADKATLQATAEQVLGDLKRTEKALSVTKANVRYFKNELKLKSEILPEPGGRDTIFIAVRDSVNTQGDSIKVVEKEIKIYPTYGFDFNNDHIGFKAKVDRDSASFTDIRFLDEFKLVSTKKTPLFKKNTQHIYLTSESPYLESMDVSSLTLEEKKKRFGLSLVAGLGIVKYAKGPLDYAETRLTGNITTGQFIGIALTYDLIQF